MGFHEQLAHQQQKKLEEYRTGRTTLLKAKESYSKAAKANGYDDLEEYYEKLKADQPNNQPLQTDQTYEVAAVIAEPEKEELPDTVIQVGYVLNGYRPRRSWTIFPSRKK